MSCVVQWWDVLFVKGMHFSSKNARLLNFIICVFALAIEKWLVASHTFQNCKICGQGLLNLGIQLNQYAVHLTTYVNAKDKSVKI